ncbi:MAG: hypothetical protein GY771_06660 [bacterium]|nr:hypothetical protein [bacterium]
MAFIRYKGPYAYLVHSERLGGGSNVRQKVLHYFGRDVAITDEVIAEVEAKFPDVDVDWDSLSGETGHAVGSLSDEGDWLEWD